MTYFQTDLAAARYEHFRPKVHGIVASWIRAALPGRRFRHAVDVGCGTGDSMIPLLTLADTVEGIDASPAMVARARSRGLAAQEGTGEDLGPARFDLITAGMAFHWLDRTSAVESFRRASSDPAFWLIYNFNFLGHRSDARFNGWLAGWYRERFPAPARASTEFVVSAAETDLTELVREHGTLPLSFTRDSLIGYLTTQSNVEDAINHGATYGDVERQLDESMPPAPASDFMYSYSYTLVRRGTV